MRWQRRATPRCLSVFYRRATAVGDSFVASVDDGTIAQILSISQRTPSWCNAQPWQVIITRGAATERFRSGLCDYVTKNPPAPDLAFPREYRGAYLERRRACGFRLYEAVGVARGDREAYAKQGFENYKLFGAPHGAIITSDEALGTYGAVDSATMLIIFCLRRRA